MPFVKGNKVNLGRKHSPEFCEEQRKRALGNKNTFGKHWKMTEKFKEDRRNYKHTDEAKRKIGVALKGEKSYMWIKDREKVKKFENQHNDPEYKQWKRAVKNRDEEKCKIGNENCGGKIEVHHILSWKEYPELRYEINNGITLCHAHHPKRREDEKQLSPYFQELIKTYER